MASKKGQPASFEKLYERLDETVQKLENGGLTLEESIGLYEEGMKLAKECQELLQAAELKVTRLQESFAESMEALRDEGEEYEAGEGEYEREDEAEDDEPVE